MYQPITNSLKYKIIIIQLSCIKLLLSDLLEYVIIFKIKNIFILQRVTKHEKVF